MDVSFRSRDGVMVLQFLVFSGHRYYIDCEENLFGDGNIFFFGRRQSPAIANTTSWFSDMDIEGNKGNSSPTTKVRQIISILGVLPI